MVQGCQWRCFDEYALPHPVGACTCLDSRFIFANNVPGWLQSSLLTLGTAINSHADATYDSKPWRPKLRATGEEGAVPHGTLYVVQRMRAHAQIALGTAVVMAGGCAMRSARVGGMGWCWRRRGSWF